MLGSSGRTIAELRELADKVGADMRGLTQVPGARGSFAEYVTVTGTAQPGSGGPMTSPVSGTECVWHRVQVERRTRRTRRTGDNNATTTETHTETVSDVRSQVAFMISDGSGALPVEPERAREESLELVREDVQSSMGSMFGGMTLSIGDVSIGSNAGGDVSETTREWVIRTGSRLTVAGTLTDRRGDLALMTVQDVPLVLSRLDHDELVAKEKKTQRTMMITALVMTVVGVGLLIGALIAALV
jgi:hypothetical protein